MDQTTVVIHIRDQDPLNVSATRLKADSSVFRYLVDDLQLTELEIEDFEPDTVILFITLLEDKKLGELEDNRFRELHKLSVVFAVRWLTDQARSWLQQQISILEVPTDQNRTLYLFEECLYIFDKWGIEMFIDMLTLKLVQLQSDNRTFIQDYVRQHSFLSLSRTQISSILKLAYNMNTLYFLNILLEQIQGTSTLEDNAKYLLQNINLALCFEQNEDKCSELFTKLANLPEIKTQHLMLIANLLTESIRKIKAYTYKIERQKETLIFDGQLEEQWQNAEDESSRSFGFVEDRISEGYIQSMFEVIEILVDITHAHSSNNEEAISFVTTLEKIAIDKRLKRVSRNFVNMIITAVKHSNRYAKISLIYLLELIKSSKHLSSYLDNVKIQDTLPSTSRSPWYKAVKYLVGGGRGSSVLDTVIPFRFSHPASAENCKEPGDCGFLLLHSHYEVGDLYLSSPAFRVKLLRGEDDYRASGVHFHDEICSDEMFFYEVRSFKTVDGETVCVPDRWRGKYGWWKKWFESVEGEEWKNRWKVEYACIEYNIRNYLVTKQ